MKRQRKQPPSEHEQKLMAEWRLLAKQPCALHGRECRPLRRDVHHLIDRQKLRRTARDLGLDVAEVCWDRRNALVVCREPHESHTNASKRFPRSIIPLDAWRFAEELGLTWWLQRRYPE